MSDLQHLLRRFAEEGEQRGADAVLDAALTTVTHRRNRRRVRWVVATVVVLTVAIGGTTVIVRSGNHDGVRVVTAPTSTPTVSASTATAPSNALAPIPAPQTPREQIQVPLDRADAPIAVGSNKIWVGGASGIEAFDPVTMHQLGAVPTVLPVLELVSSSDGLWVLSGRDDNLDGHRNPRYHLERIASSTLKVQQTMDLPFAVGYHSSWHIRLAALSGTAWVALGSSVLRIDSHSGAITQLSPAGAPVGNMAVDHTGVWIIADNAPLLQHIDAATNAVTTIPGLPDGFYWSIATTTDAAWLVASTDARAGLQLMRVDAATHAIATYRIPGIAPVADDDQLWVQVIDPHGRSLNFDNLVAQIDTRTGRLLRTVRISIGEEPGSSGNGYPNPPFAVIGNKIWSAYHGLQRTTLDRAPRASTPTPQLPVGLSLVNQPIWAPLRQTVTMKLHIDDPALAATPGAAIAIRIHQSTTSRSGLDEAIAKQNLGGTIYVPNPISVASLHPDRHGDVSIEFGLPGSGIRPTILINRPGVYPVEVQLVNTGAPSTAFVTSLVIT
jgi:hypothetical protein